MSEGRYTKEEYAEAKRVIDSITKDIERTAKIQIKKMLIPLAICIVAFVVFVMWSVQSTGELPAVGVGFFVVAGAIIARILLEANLAYSAKSLRDEEYVNEKYPGDMLVGVANGLIKDNNGRPTVKENGVQGVHDYEYIGDGKRYEDFAG